MSYNMNKFRPRSVIEITWSNGLKTIEDLPANNWTSDKQILDYYRVGRIFNVGDGENDLELKIKNVKFLLSEEQRTKKFFDDFKKLENKYKKVKIKRKLTRKLTRNRK